MVRFLTSIPAGERNAYLNLLVRKNLDEGVLAQNRFFATNNPGQPLVGGARGLHKWQERATSDRNAVNDATKGWKVGRPPKVSEMAKLVRLNSTYEFIYFLTSNFVHFNPQSLLRTGWGDEKAQRVTFSIFNLENYYAQVAIVYGTVLFLGYAYSAPELFGWPDKLLASEIKELEAHLSETHRWPEAVTFEEMNIKPPLFLLTHALGKMMHSDDQRLQILAELKQSSKRA